MLPLILGAAAQTSEEASLSLVAVADNACANAALETEVSSTQTS